MATVILRTAVNRSSVRKCRYIYVFCNVNEVDIFLVNMVEVQSMIGFDHIHIKFNTTVFRLVMQIFVGFTGHYKKQSITINRSVLITEDILGNPVKMLLSCDRCGLARESV